MATRVNVDFTPEQILKLKGLEKNGPAQRFFVGELKKNMEPYVPRLNGVLIDTAIENQDSIVYVQPYDLVGVEHLPEDTKSYAIEASVTSQPIKKRYINGDTERRFNFVLASREYFGADVAENIDVAEFYEDFSDWLERCTINNELPEMDKGKRAIKIQALTNGYVFNADATKAQYQIQCQLIYYQKLGGI